MSEHWRTRGHHPLLGVIWRRLWWCPPLRTAFFRAWNRHRLAYWLRREDGTWERVA